MNKSFIFLKKNFLKKYRKKIIYFLVLLSFFSLILFFGIKTLYGSWWTIYPQRITSFIAVNRLAVSVYENPWCRLDCYLERQVYYQEILNFLNNDKFSQKIKKIILNEEENLTWRLELLKVLSLAENREDLNIIVDLQSYLEQSSGNLAVKQAIAFYFSNNISGEYLDFLKNQIADDSYSISDRILALKNLSLVGQSQADFYLALLELSSEDNFNIELLRFLGADEGRFYLRKEKLFTNLEKIIISPDSSFTSRRLAIFILSDFLEVDFLEGCLSNNEEPEIINDNSNFLDVEDQELFNYKNNVCILFESLILNKNVDIFSRYLLIDIFNNYTQKSKNLPKISSEDWDYYYAN